MPPDELVPSSQRRQTRSMSIWGTVANGGAAIPPVCTLVPSFPNVSTTCGLAGVGETALASAGEESDRSGEVIPLYGEVEWRRPLRGGRTRQEVAAFDRG